MAQKQFSDKTDAVRIENLRIPTDLEIEEITDTIEVFYKWRNYRSGPFIQFQRFDFESMLSKSRELFWNALTTPSDDLRELDLEFSLPFVRKEVLQFVGKISSQNYKGRFNGDSLDIFGVKVLQGLYDRWRFKTNDKVEKFWETLYGVVNGTTALFVGYNDAKLTRRYLRAYDKATGEYEIEEKEERWWNDVWTEIVPIEDIYIPKIFERNFQKQGECIWKTEMPWKQFRSEFRNYDNAEYVYPGNMIAEDSLYYRLLQGTGILGGDKIQILKRYDWVKDKFIISANGILLNPIGKGRKQKTSPMPFNHKMGPFAWGQMLPLDEKLAYGLPLPFLIKEPHKLLNVSTVMLMEHELRNISPAIISSDFDAPKLIFGQHEIVQVNDVEAYKEFKLSEPSNAFFNMMGNLKTEMGETAQGGGAPAMPSRQPRSSREVLQLEALKQQVNSITLLMYYNVLRQQMMLVIKTALQFYPLDKYRKEGDRIIRALSVPNASLTTGGTGTLNVRIVNKKKDNLELFFEALMESMLNGRPTEIIEAPVEVIQGLEFQITDIDMEPEQTDAMRKAEWFEQVFQPMVQFYVPAGIVDAGKLFLRHMEKMGEHPVDYANEKILSQLMQVWEREQQFPLPMGAGGGQGGGLPAQVGNARQSDMGTRFGMQSNEGIPVLG